MEKFIVKCTIITCGIGILLYCFLPRYHFFDSTHRVNILSGKSEYYDPTSHRRGWYSYD